MLQSSVIVFNVCDCDCDVMVQKVVDELSRARARDCRLAASSLPPHHA